MKKIFLITAFCTFVLGMNSAHAVIDCFTTNAVTVNGDSGTDLKRCLAPNSSDCYDYTECLGGVGRTWAYGTSSSCPATYSFTGKYAISGERCCYKSSGLPCTLVPPEMRAEAVRSSMYEGAGAASLEDVFGSMEPKLFAESYWGMAGSVIRSPNNGRTVSATARLDACLYHTDVDAITDSYGSNYDRWVACKGSTLGCDALGSGGNPNLNEYCRATNNNDGSSTTAGVCKDRCDCVYGQGTCESL